MKTAKKILNFLSSMRFAMILLILLIIACVFGSVISQGEDISYYTSNYPAWAASLITGCGVDDVFHVWWFVVLTMALCLNLLCCNLLRFMPIIRQMKSYTPERAKKLKIAPVCAIKSEPKTLFESMSFSKVEAFTTEDGSEGFYAVRNRIGVWGAWLTHLGILVIIIGFALGQMTATETTVYGVTGQTKPVDGTNYELTIDDFTIGLRKDETVEQYTSKITLTDTATGESWSGETSVNHPLSINGMRIYQNSTGWAADVQVYQDDELVQTEVVCAGEYTTVEAVEGLYVVFSSFYPDYTLDASGMPMTASSSLRNPAYLYMLYYGDTVLGMNVLKNDEAITISDKGLKIVFTNPRQYSLLQVKTDHYTGIALLGALILMVALMLDFYLRTEELWTVHGADGKWLVYGASRKGGILYKEKILKKANAPALPEQPEPDASEGPSEASCPADSENQ